MNRHLSFAVLAAVLLSGPPGIALAAEQCAPEGNVRFLCGHQKPEDLVVVPGNDWVLTSWYGGNGGLFLVNARDRSIRPFFPAPTARDEFDRKRYAGCPGPMTPEHKAKLQFAGITLLPGRNSVHRVYAVHHGPRESVEVFELDARGDAPTGKWLGCAVAPDATFNLNSVVGLPDGGFIVSSFSHRGVGGPDAFARMAKGEVSGELWEWHPGGNWEKVPGSETAGPNGIELSRDGKWLYIAGWGSQAFSRLSRGGSGAPKRDSVSLGFRLDNARFAPDGTIYVAGQTESEACKDQLPPCRQGGGTRVVKIDPESLEATILFERPDTDLFGFGTSAVVVNDEVWVGSWQKNSIAVFPARR